MDENHLSIIEVELIFTKAIGLADIEELSKPTSTKPYNKHSRLNFQRFLSAVQIIAEKVYLKLTPIQSFAKFINKVIFHLF